MCRHRRSAAPPGAVPTLIVFGSGGHTAEMLNFLQVMPTEAYGPYTYVMADTDKTSEARAKSSGIVPNDAQFLMIPRSREVGQSYAEALLMTIRAFIVCLHLVWALQPGLILVNGPGTCLPMCVAAVVLRAMCLASSKVVFVESVCRVKSLSMTGKLLYYLRIADQVQVQWPELAAAYPGPRVRSVGMLM